MVLDPPPSVVAPAVSSLIITLIIRYTCERIIQLLLSGYVGMENYCLRQNITTQGMLTYPLDSNCFTIAKIVFHIHFMRQPRWLRGLRRSHVHSLMIARRSLCPEQLGSNPGQGSKGINLSGWYSLDMSITVTKRR